MALVLRCPSRSQPELLFIHRAEREQDPWSGHMAFPGGRREKEDPDERATAERETREEIGLRLSEHAAYLGRLDDVQARTRGRLLSLAISPFVYWLPRPVPVRTSLEVQDTVWIPILHLYDAERWETLCYPHESRRYELPCIRFRDKVVWGLTLMILGDFLKRLVDSGLQSWIRGRLDLRPDVPLPPIMDVRVR